MSNSDMPPPSYAAATGAPVSPTQTNQYVHNRQLPDMQPSAPLHENEKLPVPQPVSQPMPQPSSQPGWNPNISDPAYTPTPAAPETDTTSITWREMISDECTPRVLLGYFWVITITTLLMGFVALGAIYGVNIYIIMIVFSLGIVLVLYIAHKYINNIKNWNVVGLRRRYYY